MEGCPTPPLYAILASLPIATFSAFGAVLPVPYATPAPVPVAVSVALATTHKLDNNTPLINKVNKRFRLFII